MRLTHVLALAATFTGLARTMPGNDTCASSSTIHKGIGATQYNVTTITKSDYTTYCPHPTTIPVGNVTYTVTKPTTLTITNCPCTIVSKPGTTVPEFSSQSRRTTSGPAAPSSTSRPGTISPLSSRLNRTSTVVTASQTRPGTISPSATRRPSTVPTAAAGRASTSFGALALAGLAAFVI